MAAAPEVCIYFLQLGGAYRFSSDSEKRLEDYIIIIALSKIDRFAPSSHRRLRFKNSC